MGMWYALVHIIVEHLNGVNDALAHELLLVVVVDVYAILSTYAQICGHTSFDVLIASPAPQPGMSPRITPSSPTALCGFFSPGGMVSGATGTSEIAARVVVDGTS